MAKKPMMMLDTETMSHMHLSSTSGMNFHIIETHEGLFVALQSGEVMPLFPHSEAFCLPDYLGGKVISSRKSHPSSMDILRSYSGRHESATAIRQANISTSYTGSAGASPLISR